MVIPTDAEKSCDKTQHDKNSQQPSNRKEFPQLLRIATKKKKIIGECAEKLDPIRIASGNVQ